MRWLSAQRILAVGSLCSLLVACGTAPATTPAASSAASSVASPSAVAGGTVTVRLFGDWGVPVDGGQTVTSATGGQLAEAMYDRLVEFVYTAPGVVPYLASSWQVTPTSVTFKLRTDATCSDGTPITPTVVYDSFARLISPKTASRWPSTIWGAGPYSIAKDDAAGTFTFSTAIPYNNLLSGFAFAWTGIVCPKGLEPGADFTKQSYGSGPWVFDSAVQGSDYIVAKRKGWNWGPQGGRSDQSGFPDKLDFKVVSNETTAANLVVTGGLDIGPVNGPDATRLLDDKTVEGQASPSYAPYTLQINEAAGRPGTEEAVRKALLTALDPKAWNQAAFAGTAIPSTNFQSNAGGYCYTDLSSIIPKPSVPDARQILLSAGYSPGPDGKLQKAGKTLTINIVASTAAGHGGEYISSTLEQVGLKTVLTNVDAITFSQTFAKTDYDIIVGQFGSTTPTPAGTPNFFTGKFPPAGNNRINRDDPALAVLVANAYAAAPGDPACQAWKELNTYLITNSIALPWPAPVTQWFSKTGTFKYQPTGQTLIPPTIRRLK